MPVRGSTEWQHAQIMRKVVNHDAGDGRKIVCATIDCENDGYEQYKIRQCEHLRSGHAVRWDPDLRVRSPLTGEVREGFWVNDGPLLSGAEFCAAVDAGVALGLHRHYVFCSERHKAMFHFDHGPQGLAMLESRGGMYGYLPTGYRGLT